MDNHEHSFTILILVRHFRLLVEHGDKMNTTLPCSSLSRITGWSYNHAPPTLRGLLASVNTIHCKMKWLSHVAHPQRYYMPTIHRLACNSQQYHFTCILSLQCHRKLGRSAGCPKRMHPFSIKTYAYTICDI